MSYGNITFAAAALGVAVFAGPAHAQEAPTQSTMPVAGAADRSKTDVAPVCEMHVWPAARVTAITTGWGAMFGLVGGMIDAATNADRNKRDKAFITGALDSAAQARALRELSLPRLLNLPASNVITHDEGIELNSATIGRLSASSAPCYYDVVVRQLLYVKTATTKGKMRTMILVRGSDGKRKFIDYKDSANHAIDVKLPEEGQDVTAASSALINAFKSDFTEFGQKFVRKQGS
ncbi:MAG TPA: hypothetical protein VGU01_11205 [Sphingomicrobium sp.]|nr:hypothetical protein [Sphingomicrobium sp.]